ncbi:MAG TPA: TspO/MBR family protein [Ignavibacteriaceae bacterium]|nr:TspO/MBR family protein [Ignavibacteriaceae bacterium]
MSLKFRINYLLIPLFVIITASAASHFADTGMAWYRTINLPDWTPSNSLIVIAWTIIFVLTSLSILVIWNKYYTEKDFGLIISLFIMNAVLNVGWNILFFTQQQMELAFFWAILLISNIILLIYFIWKFSPLTASLLLPYSLWVIFSTILIFKVWSIN